MRALKIAATGMAAQQMQVEVISNNLANMSTTGYNARRADFADLHYQQVTKAGSIAAADGSVVPAGVQLGLGVRATAVSMEVAQGALAATGGDLDIAIEGRGFLEVTLPSGISAYTRDGALKSNGDGQLVTADGHPIVPDITIPEETQILTITPSGEVYANFADEVDPQLLGELTLTVFDNDKGLEAIGSNLFRETGASGNPTVGAPGENGTGFLRQGYLEESSVDAVREITDLIEAQRGYELNSKVISAADQMLGTTTSMR